MCVLLQLNYLKAPQQMRAVNTRIPVIFAFSGKIQQVKVFVFAFVSNCLSLEAYL